MSIVFMFLYYSSSFNSIVIVGEIEGKHLHRSQSCVMVATYGVGNGERSKRDSNSFIPDTTRLGSIAEFTGSFSMLKFE